MWGVRPHSQTEREGARASESDPHKEWCALLYAALPSFFSLPPFLFPFVVVSLLSCDFYCFVCFEMCPSFFFFRLSFSTFSDSFNRYTHFSSPFVFHVQWPTYLLWSVDGIDGMEVRQTGAKWNGNGHQGRPSCSLPPSLSSAHNVALSSGRKDLLRFVLSSDCCRAFSIGLFPCPVVPVGSGGKEARGRG